MEKNREIKFKGFSKERNKWVYGDILQDYTGEVSICFFVDTLIEPENNYREPVLTYVSVEKESIGQYTGLHDKNGKEIYEGDIVKDHYCEYSDDSFTVKFYNGAFYPMVQVKEGYNCILKYDKEQFEVIGNIYEPTNNI